MQGITNVLKTIIDFQSVEDGTYEYLTHEIIEYFSGYQVSFVRPEAFEQLSCDEWDTLTTYYCGYLQSKAHIGVYGGSVEISFHSIEFLKVEEIMKEFNQESILDWKERAEHPDDFTHWFIMNRNYDENKLVNYHEILERVH